MPQEIERKFLLNDKEVPKDLLENTVSLDLITQFYTVADEDLEIRYHRQVNIDGEVSCFKTAKCGVGLKRSEDITPITEEAFGNTLYPDSRTPIHKCRISAIDDETGLEFEIDTYQGVLFGLRVVEVEFKTEEEAHKFKVPEWFGKEVTYDSSYKNKNLWRKINQLETLG